MTKYTSVDFDIESIELEYLLEYWKKLKKDQVLPFRHQFDPVAVPQCLKYIVLIDVKQNSPKYFIRLAGSAVNPAYMKPVAGRYMEDILKPQDLKVILPQYEYTIRHRVPTYMVGSAEMPSRVRLSYERLLLPMTTDGQNVDKLVIGIKFEDVKQELLDRPISKA
jgi:hypothetical protein